MASPTLNENGTLRSAHQIGFNTVFRVPSFGVSFASPPPAFSVPFSPPTMHAYASRLLYMTCAKQFEPLRV